MMPKEGKVEAGHQRQLESKGQLLAMKVGPAASFQVKK